MPENRINNLRRCRHRWLNRRTMLPRHPLARRHWPCCLATSRY